MEALGKKAELDGVKATKIMRRILLAFLATEDTWMSVGSIALLTGHSLRVIPAMRKLEEAGWVETKGVVLTGTDEFFSPILYRLVRKDNARQLLKLASDYTNEEV